MKIQDLKLLVRQAWQKLHRYLPHNKSLKLWLKENGHQTDLRLKSVWLTLYKEFCEQVTVINEQDVKTAVQRLIVKTNGWFHLYEIVKLFPSIDKEILHRWLLKWEKEGRYHLSTLGNCGWLYPQHIQDWGIPANDGGYWGIKYQFICQPGQDQKIA